ncbi:dynamin family protein [Umezawaea tangerina]|uniref:Dynamin family protein n=1 Tax=Umezawaea tangerina TaxID=84725 RepID=A0A2T0T6P1_9PSEU|nr:dynamin family protein [Umezawaea tangerina]PRY41330.1 dynamin family protein [Umezawaea tangerina]
MSTAPQTDGFAAADDQRDRLLAICEQLGRAAGQLGDNAEAIAEEAEIAKDDAFRVMFVGDFNRGKSTLVNSLLGEPVLPVKAVETTAVITYVKYREQRLARLWPTDTTAAPVEVDPKELGNRITVDTADPDKDNPYRLAEVFWRLELCRHNVVIVDSPGLNVHNSRDDITQTELRRADAVVFVQHAIASMSTAETQFLKNHLRAHDPFFVFTRFDDIDEDERATVMSDARARIAGVREKDTDADRTFFVDARGALRAKVAGDKARFVESGVEALEKAMETFLVRDRHRAKMLPRVNTLRGLAQELHRTVPQQLALLDVKSEDLARKWEEAQQPLRSLEKEAQQISAELANHRAMVEGRIESLLAEGLRAIAGEVQGIAVEAPVETTLTLVPWKVKERAENAATEIAQSTLNIVEERMVRWAEERLGPLVVREMEAVTKQLNTRLCTFEANLEKLRTALSGIARADSMTDSSEETPLLRFIGAVGGLAFGGLAGGLIGARFGPKEALRTLLPTLAIYTAWMFTPFGLPTLAGMLVVQALVQGKSGLSGVERKIRANVGAELAKQLRLKAPELARKVAGQLAEEHIEPIEEAVSTGMANRLAAVERSVREARQATESGAEEVDRRKAEYQEVDRTVRRAIRDLGDLVDELVVT